MSFLEKCALRTFFDLNLFCWRLPMSTAGTPKTEVSLIPDDELPTTHEEYFIREIKSSGGNSLIKVIRWPFLCSLNILMAFETSSVPASIFGQNHNTCPLRDETASRRSLACS